MRLGDGGRHARQTGAMLSEKCVARRGRAWDGMRVSTVCFTRALQRCAGRTNMHFLFILQEVRAIGKTRNQFRIKPHSHPGRTTACVHPRHGCVVRLNWLRVLVISLTA